MTTIEAYNHITSYFKVCAIKFFAEDYEAEDYERITRLTIAYEKHQNCPDMALEGSIDFFSNSMECRVYYKQGTDTCKNSAHQAGLYRLLNYINATVLPCVSYGYEDGYRTRYLYTPRIYVTEDDCYDITVTVVIPYALYEISPFMAAGYITVSIPELMNKLSLAIFEVLGGRITAKDAIEYVKTTILKGD